MAKNKSAWPIDRRKELEMLITLLQECCAINSANNIIPRLQRIEKLAEKLRRFDHSKPRAAFTQFLIEQAFPDAKR